MDKDGILSFLREVTGTTPEIQVSDRWISLGCLLSPWTHAHGKDKRPSAGISIADGGTSIYHCFGCHKKGPLTWLLSQLEKYTGEDWTELKESLGLDETFSGNIPEWDAAPSVDGLPEPLDEEIHFGLYESAEDLVYLQDREITNATVRKLGLVFDPDDSGGRVLFPVYGTDQLLYGFSGRAIRKDAKLKVKDYFGLPKRKLLLGSHLIRPKHRFLLLVEGLFDYAKLSQYGYAVVAMMSSSLTNQQADILRDIGLPIYVIHDNDNPGLEARERVKDLLCRHVPLMKVRYPKECTVETLEGDLRKPLDPAELTPDQISQMIREARIL